MGATIDELENLHKGMSSNEVKELLGDPIRIMSERVGNFHFSLEAKELMDLPGDAHMEAWSYVVNRDFPKKIFAAQDVGLDETLTGELSVPEEMRKKADLDGVMQYTWMFNTENDEKWNTIRLVFANGILQEWSIREGSSG